MRKEKDSMGIVEVPDNVYYGAQTKRAYDNFPISDIKLSSDLIYAIAIIKRSAAIVNHSLGKLELDVKDAIVRASNDVLDHKLDKNFIIDVYQTGSGTSTNMNVNEVIANRANEILGKKLGKNMKAAKAKITGLTHDEAVAALDSGSLEVEGVAINTKTGVVSKLSFSKESEEWEATPSQEGDIVVAIDCTQDEAILSAGKSRELINHVQQLRKAAGLDLKDTVEVFFDEEEGIASTENAVAMNVSLFVNKPM